MILAKKDVTILELIPPSAWGDDLPTRFREDFVHWRNLDNENVEFRPLSDCWSTKEDNWWLLKGRTGKFTLCRGGSNLLDRHSQTSSLISQVLRPLEEPQFIHISFETSLKEVKIHLPRLKLDFVKRCGLESIQSSQYRGMHVDVDQSIGTLTGLVSKLVLRNIAGTERSVLIPFGQVMFGKDKTNHHVRVQISSAADQVPYYHYRIDDLLGRLVDSDLESLFFRCYMHALTSNIMVDDLLKKTGTEEALTILESAAARSFKFLNQTETNILKQIGDLTPTRRFYPVHLKVMQTVKWADLPCMSQHLALHSLTEDILEQDHHYREMFDVSQEVNFSGPEHEGRDFLTERAALRDSSFRVHGFGGEKYTQKYDLEYKSRDNRSESDRELRVYKVASLVNEWTSQECSPNLFQEMLDWGQPIHGYQGASPDLSFDLEWLNPLKDFMPSCWFKFVSALSKSDRGSDRYRVMFFLGTLAFSQYCRMELVLTLLAFATSQMLQSMPIPHEDSYRLSEGFEFQKLEISSAIRSNIKHFDTSPEAHAPALPGESYWSLDKRRRSLFADAVDSEVSQLTTEMHNQWPRSEPELEGSPGKYQHIFLRSAMEQIGAKFRDWYWNRMLRSAVHDAQPILDGVDHGLLDKNPYSPPGSSYNQPRQWKVFGLDHLFSKPAPLLEKPHRDFRETLKYVHSNEADIPKLDLLLQRVRAGCSSEYDQQYVSELWQSVEALKMDAQVHRIGSIEEWQHKREQDRRACSTSFHRAHNVILESLAMETSISAKMVMRLPVRPRLTPLTLLGCLVGFPNIELSGNWRSTLTQYAMILRSKQQATRLLSYAVDDPRLIPEILSVMPAGWDAMEHPEWLVFEIEQNISIRTGQYNTAQEVMSPESGSNSLMQLNMGEGKSSVVVPMIAAALTKQKTQLVRIIVLKSLAQQMFRLLVGKLGGLLNRRIWQLPISRSIRITADKAARIGAAFRECMRSGGVLLAQPEHVQSFELMGIERFWAGCTDVGQILTDSQLWLNKHARDILDESDEILNVRSELIYTIGAQQSIDLCPERWTLIEELLGLFLRCCKGLASDGLEMKQGPAGRFHQLRVLKESAGREALEKLVSCILDGRLSSLSVWTWSAEDRQLIRRYIHCHHYDRLLFGKLQERVKNDDIWKKLLLLRGLCAGGVLMFAFMKKRWRVSYGLFPARTLLAVPYLAKDIPAVRADFSHPDVAIILTCLSYYYNGLTDDQLVIIFEKIKSCDNALEKYANWVRDADQSLPELFRHLSNVNLTDTQQCQLKVFPAIRFAKSVIDYYLTEVVFPAEMKEFPYKLSSSGWNLAKEKQKVITGFSGTNDSKAILPLSIQQRDLPSHLSTNACVLEWILRSRNTYQSLPEGSCTKAQALLQTILEARPPVRVIIDVGAQILEWRNEEVAQRWLFQNEEAQVQAAIFFNENDEMLVLTRDGFKSALAVSPFVDQLDKCLVYLDEAHTRGTDLRLPKDYRAAVTLGPSLTKDRLTQGKRLKAR